MNETSRHPTFLRTASRFFKGTLLVATASLAILTGSMDPAQAMDTDIFAATTNSATAPNVLIILDNTANAVNQKQHFEGGAIFQGQAEANAIKTAINSLPGNINVGLMEFVTKGPATDAGGFVRYAISPMGQSDTNGATNRTNFSAILTTIYNNFHNPDERIGQSVGYGDLMYDAYNYLAGTTPYATSGDVDSTKADSNGYVTNYTKFKSPLSSGSTCGTTYIIFIGNAPSNPKSDTSTNLPALAALGGNTTQLKLPDYVTTVQNLSDNIGYSTGCYTSQPTSTTDSKYVTCQASVTSGSYTSCTYSSADTSSALDTCASGQRYAVVSTSPNTTTTSTTTTTTTNSSTTNSCYLATSSWSSSSDKGSLPACPSNTSTTVGNVTTANSYSCSYSVTATGQSSTGCGTSSSTSTGADQVTTADSTTCYSNLNSWSTSDKGTLTCPSNTSVTSGGTTTNTTYACTYTGALTGSTTSCGNNKQHVTVTQTATPTITITGQTYKFPVTQTVTKTTTTTTVTAGASSTTLGNTLSCYASQAACSTSDYTCPAGTTCACSTPTTTTGVCPAGTRYQVLGNYTANQQTPTNPPTSTLDTATYNADEWSRFLSSVGVPVGSTKQTVSTYTIDVYKDQPSATQSALLSSMARNGNGKYFSATNSAAILTALQSIFAEVQAVNNTFASAALPISATNRAQNSNQVYIGMFRPDQGAHPRWFGNLKRYQVANVGGFDGLAGQDNKAAVSNTTGFVTPCAKSFWSTTSSNYWYDSTNSLTRIFITQATSGNAGTAWDAAGNDDNFSKGSCDTTTQWSDLPDGPTVEKGGAAQVLRNNFATRKMYTIGSGTTNSASLLTFSTSTTGLSANSTINTNIAKFIMGQDVTGEISLSGSASARPSIHGDVIHSRPLPVDHGGTTGVVIYYGAGDGVYRAVRGSDGVELWAFVAPESYSTLQRLMDNSPLVLTPNPTPPGQTAVAGTSGRDFFFDGSTGVYQNTANTKVWVFPSMRRGGRMLYAFDVSTPTTPTLKWRRGCLDQASDANCTTGMTGIGQTWSTPQVAKVNGYKDASGNYLPVIIVGGGYDTCEDADTATPSCSSPKGARIYVLDADTGTLLSTFESSAATNSGSGPAARSIAADVALVDTNGDGVVDYAYAADTGGNIYRVDFPSTATSATDWKMSKVAYTNITPSNSYRKFFFTPGVLPYKGSIYLAIASGDREHPLALSYPYTTPVLNRAYLYLDDPTRTGAFDLDGVKLVDESASAPDCGATKILPGTTNYGWHMDLKAACTGVAAGCGEQGVTSALIFGGMVTWSTNRPTGAAETCASSLGQARGYFVNLLNGSGAIGVTGTCGGQTSTIFPGGGLPPSAVAATVSVDGKEETILIGAPCKDGTSCAPIQAQKLSPPISSRRTRTYWKVNTDNK